MRIDKTIDDSHPEFGGAIVEFATLGVLLLLPMIYFCLYLGQLQAAALASAAASQAVATSVAESETGSDAQAGPIAAMVAQDFGFDASRVEIGVTCSGSCAEPGAQVSARVSISPDLPLLRGVDSATSISSESVVLRERFPADALRPGSTGSDVR